MLNIGNYLENKRNSSYYFPLVKFRDYFNLLRTLFKNPYQNIVLPEYEAIYIPIPKVASTSLKSVFTEKETGKDVHKIDFRTIKKNKIEKKPYENYFKFSFVRNPYLRLFSCWKDKVRDDFKKSFYIYPNMREGMTFENFIKLVSRIPDSLSNPHFLPQYKFLEGIDIDFLGKIEEMNRDFEVLANKLKIEKKLPKFNSSSEQKEKIKISKSTKLRILERYKEDFMKFNYNLDLK